MFVINTPATLNQFNFNYFKQINKANDINCGDYTSKYNDGRHC